MDGTLWGPAVFTLPGAMAAGVFVLAISVGAMILGYLADEARMGRGTSWPELPAVATGYSTPTEKVEVRRAA